MGDNAHDTQAAPTKPGIFAKENRGLLFLSIAIALAAVAAALYFAGPNSQQRAAALREQEEARVVALLLSHCELSGTPITGTQTYRCGIFVELRDGARVTFIPAILVTSEGTMIRTLDHPAGEILDGLPLSEFGSSNYYTRNPDAIAMPDDDNFGALGKTWAEQEMQAPE